DSRFAHAVPCCGQRLDSTAPCALGQLAPALAWVRKIRGIPHFPTSNTPKKGELLGQKKMREAISGAKSARLSTNRLEPGLFLAPTTFRRRPAEIDRHCGGQHGL